MSRPIRVTLTPTALDRNGIGAIQTLVAGALDPILNGTLATGYDVNAVCVAQTTADSAALLLNGVLGSGVSGPRKTEERLIFTSTSDNSSITYAIVGKNDRQEVINETLAGSPASQKTFSVNAYWEVTSITSSAAVTGNVEVGINGVATFATPQHVTIWATSDESGDSFVVTGTNRQGLVITESIVGPTASATVVGAANFATVTHVSSPAAATAVEIGVDGTCESGWLPLNYRADDFATGLGVSITTGATLTFTVQQTFDDVFALDFVESTAAAIDHASLAAGSANADAAMVNPAMATRLQLTAYTDGSATFNVVQVGAG